MSIRLRVAGIFYDEKFKLSDLTPVPAFAIPGRVAPGKKPTIFELMEAAFRNPGTNKEKFIYVFERRSRSLSMTSIGVTHKKQIKKSLGGNTYPAGKYQLTEFAFPSGIVAWQYYVYRKGVSVSQLVHPPPVTGYSPATGNSSGFTGFDQFVLQDGDEVIWRQVAILREPNFGHYS
jgi:hypothetical protein